MNVMYYTVDIAMSKKIYGVTNLTRQGVYLIAELTINLQWSKE